MALPALAKSNKPTEYHNGKPVHARNAKGQPVCGARRADGRTCQSRVLMKNGRCKLDGGMNPAGVMNANYQGGRGSVLLKQIPQHLRKAYEASLRDPDQVSLEPEIALLDSNTYRLVAEMKDLTSGRRVVTELLGELPIMDALVEGATDEADMYEIAREWRTIKEIVEGGRDQEHLWDQIQQNAEARRRLTETDQKRKYQLSKVLEAKHVDTLILAILTIVRNNVGDSKIRGAIGRQVLALVAPKEAAVAEVMADEQEAEDDGTILIEPAE